MTAPTSPTSPAAGFRFGALQILIVALAITAAVIHFSRAVTNPHITVLFTMNGIGYLVLVALLYLPVVAPWRRLTRNTLIGYTALTFVLYFVWGAMKGEWLVLGFVCVAVEAVLLGALWQESRQ
jgi:hypothetical protein